MTCKRVVTVDTGSGEQVVGYMKIDGTFVSEIIGGTHKPAGWVGQGSIPLDETGLTLRGEVRGNGLITLFASLGGIVGIAGSLMLGFEARTVAGVGISLLLAGGALGAQLTQAKEIGAHIAWDAIRKPRLAENSFVFVSRIAPKGQVTFVFDAPSEATNLRTALGDQGIKVKV